MNTWLLIWWLLLNVVGLLVSIIVESGALAGAIVVVDLFVVWLVGR